MIWFAQAQQQVDIIGNIYIQWGALGLLALVLGIIIRYLYLENKELKKENNDLKSKRLEDAKDFAKLLGQPAQDLISFVRTLYELSTSDTPRKD